MAELPIFIDIDGTLTTTPEQQFGPVLRDRIRALRVLVAQGHEVIVWSGGGTDYARRFCKLVNLRDVVCIGKPAVMVDDNPTIRPPGRMVRVEPDEFFAGV